jgi:thiamine pyrophosphate-dependent acetolactate synthase large subunit-like protein
MMTRALADQFAETLARAGVKRVYGIVVDSLNGLTDALRRQGKIEWIHVRHKEVANGVVPPTVAGLLPSPPLIVPPGEDLDRLAEILNGDARVTVQCGSGCQGAQRELLALGERLQAPMVHTMRGKEHVEIDGRG